MINPYLDTAIGVAVVYLVFSILGYVVQELWAAIRESRGRMLRKAVYELLNDSLNKGFGVLLFEHPQFNFLKKTENRLPSYLPAANFSAALIDIIGRESEALRFLPHTAEKRTEVKVAAADAPNDEMTTITSLTALTTVAADKYHKFSQGLRNMNNSNLKILLENVLAESKDLGELKLNIESWYNNYMDRVTGWYKDLVTVNLRWIGLAIAVIFNVHALNVISSIYGDRQLRDKLVEVGGNMVDNGDALKSIYTSSIQSSLAQIDNECSKKMQQAGSDSLRAVIQQQCTEQRLALADSFTVIRQRQMHAITDSLKIWDLPVGWKKLAPEGSPGHSAADTGKSTNWFWQIFGWILSGFAISAGAPFWFELLSKLINIRRSGLKPSTTPKDDTKK
jgi:hypothetical protein